MLIALLWIVGYMICGIISVPLFDAFDDRIVGRYADERSPGSVILLWPIYWGLVSLWTLICLIGIAVYLIAKRFQKAEGQ